MPLSPSPAKLLLSLYAQLGPRINAHSPRQFSLLIKSSSFYVKIMVNVSQNRGPTLELAVGIRFLADTLFFSYKNHVYKNVEAQITL